MSILHDEEFLKLEREFPFLGRAREKFGQPSGSLDDVTFTILDIETTGLDPVTCEILEIGAIKCRAGKSLETFHTMIKPLNPIPPTITSITGISAPMVADAPLAPAALQKFSAFIHGTVLVAHNTEFDLGFLGTHMRKSIDQKLTHPAICTVKLSRALIANLENYKLHTVAKFFNVATPNRHRAMGDCEITIKVWAQLYAKLKEQGKKTIQDINSLIEQSVVSAASHGEVPF